MPVPCPGLLLRIDPRLLAAQDHSQRAVPLTVFVPARFEESGRVTAVRPVPSQGSGDLAAMARADCLMVVAPGESQLAAGTAVRVLPK